MKFKLTLIIFILGMLGLSHFSLSALDKTKLPKLLGSSNMGREFYFSFLPCWETTGGGPNDLKIYISSAVRTKVIVSVREKGYEKIKYTVPNEIIEFSLDPAIGQPYQKVPWTPPDPDGVYSGDGIHIIADDPIICYGVTRFQYTSDGFLAIPVNALGKEYIISSFADVSSNSGQWLPSMFSVTAAYDKTKILFTMGGTDWSKTVSGQQPGQTSQWNLNKGDVLLISSLGTKAELTGSLISSTKPVAVVSGNYCAYVPTNCGCCDVIEEMELPTNTWGTEYHVTPIINRLKHSIIKVFAKEPQTTIYRDGNELGLLKTAGGTANNGFFELRANDGSPKPIIISGDKPISVTQFNTGQGDDGIASDPFQMNLVSTVQYQREITFNTPGIYGGSGFPLNYLNLCYESDTAGTIPDDLEISFYNTKDSVFKYYKLKDSVGKIGKPFYSDSTSKQYSMLTYKLPVDGVYKIRAGKPVQAYIYGFSWCDSYGFPASVALKNPSIEDSLPPAPDWKMDCEGNVNYDKARFVYEKPDPPATMAKLSSINLHNDVSYNYKLYHSDFMPCEDLSATWRLKIIDPTEDARAVVTFADCNGNDSTMVFEYFVPNLIITENSFNFGNHSVGNESWHKFHIVNNSSGPWTCNNFKLKNKDEQGIDNGFELYDENKSASVNIPFTIPAGDTFYFWVKFSPSLEGTWIDSIGFGDDCFFSYQFAVRSDVGMPIISVSDWNFPPTYINKKIQGQFDIKNLGSVNLEVYGFKGLSVIGEKSGTKIFLSDDLDGRNISRDNPLVFKPLESKTFIVEFSPDDTLSYLDTIKIISNSIPVFPNGDYIDSICIIAGNGLMSELIASSYNWERKRIHRPGKFDMPPYPAEINAINADSCIRLFNGGNTALTINKISDKEIIGDKSAFIFNKSDIVGKTFYAHQNNVIEVFFQPQDTGYYHYQFEYETDNPEIKDATTTLQGTGIIPKVTAENFHLYTDLFEYMHPAQNNVTIKNVSCSDWEFCDSLTIFDIIFENIHEDMDLSWSSFNESFRINKPDFNFPLVIQPGDSLTYPIFFVARNKEQVNARIKVLSDAINDTLEIKITGSTNHVASVNNNNFEIAIYPNPTEDILIIDKLPLNTSKIQIFDEQGKEVRSIEIKNQSESIKISTKDLPVGVYVLRMFVGTDIVDKKFVVLK